MSLFGIPLKLIRETCQMPIVEYFQCPNEFIPYKIDVNKSFFSSEWEYTIISNLVCFILYRIGFLDFNIYVNILIRPEQFVFFLFVSLSLQISILFCLAFITLIFAILVLLDSWLFGYPLFRKLCKLENSKKRYFPFAG